MKNLSSYVRVLMLFFIFTLSTLYGQSLSNLDANSIDKSNNTQTIIPQKAINQTLKKSALKATSDTSLRSMSVTSNANTVGFFPEGSAGEQKNISYRTDSETELISQAIREYNKEHPDSPIKEVSKDTLLLLKNLGYIKEIPTNIADLVFSDGIVFRKVRFPTPDPKPLTKNTDSLKGALEAGLAVIDANSPKGKGNSLESSSVVIQDSTVLTKIHGQLVEVKTVLPRLPDPPPLKKITGKKVQPRISRLSQEALKIRVNKRKIINPLLRTSSMSVTNMPTPKNEINKELPISDKVQGKAIDHIDK